VCGVFLAEIRGKDDRLYAVPDLARRKEPGGESAALRNLERSALTSVRSKCAVRLLTPGTRSVPEFVADAGPNAQATIAAIEDEPLWFLGFVAARSIDGAMR